MSSNVLILPNKQMTVKDAKATSYQLRGQTANFAVYYDTSLGNNGLLVADAVLAKCETDYATLHSVFGGITPSSLPFNVYIQAGNNDASHASCTATDVYCDAFSGTDSDLVEMLLVAEADEVFMATKNNGWDCGASNGEGLSRVLATESYPNELDGFASAATWLDGGRPDFVNKTDPTDRNYLSIGCATLFLNFLRYQLGYTWQQIIDAGGNTLAATYQRLTGNTDAFSPFSGLLAQRFSVGKPSGLVGDNPFPIYKQRSDIGGFSTMDVRPWNEPQLTNSIDILFPAAFRAPPSIVIGLTELDIDRSKNLRIVAAASNITDNGFRASLNAWSDTVLYSAGACWLEIAANDEDFQFGQFNTLEDHSWDQPQLSTSRRIVFPRSYLAAPRVVVWLNELDISNQGNVRVNAYATEVDNGGFTVHIDTWADTTLYSGGITWMAYPADKSGVVSGGFNTQDVRPLNDLRASTSTAITFPTGLFTAAPQVRVALNSLDIDRNANSRVMSWADGISANGMTWHLDSWADTTLYSAGAAYIAIGS